MSASGRSDASSPVVRVLDGAEAPAEWRALLDAADAPAFTHRPEWTATLCRHLPRRGGLWLVAECDGRPVAGLVMLESRRGPLRVLEGHFDGTTGQPLTAAGFDEATTRRAISALLDRVRRMSRSPSVLTTVLHLPPDWDARLRVELEAHGFRRDEVPVAVIPLDQGLEHVERHIMKKNRRTERNKGLRNGAVLGATEDPAIIEEFYPLYKAASRRWGTRPIDRDLMVDLISARDGKVFCSTVHHEGELLGAHFNLVDGDMITAWIGATDLSRSKEFFPSTLLVWADLLEAVRRGAAWVDLGAHGGQAGVANFKHLIGCHEVMRGSYTRHSLGGYLWRGLRRLRRWGRS